MASDKGPGQAHFKANYIEVIKRIVPEFYAETEYNLYGEEEDLQYRALASILYTAKNTSGILPSPKTDWPGPVSSFSGWQDYVPYFVPFNNRTDVSPTRYEQHVLRPLGKTLNSFTNVEEFQDFLLTSALPQTEFNNVSQNFVSSYSSTVTPTASSVSAVSNTLLKELGWVYMLNTSGSIRDTGSRAPSSFVYSSLSNDLFYGKRIRTSDGVANIFKWLYTNCKGGGTAWNEVAANYLPAPFNAPSSTYVPTNTQAPGNYYASGGQLVSALDTLVRVWVNDDDPNSLYFKDIVDAGLMGLDVQRMENAGPMGKMLKAFAYAFYDVRTSIRDIQFLLDIEECPDDFLQYLGRYLGWTYFTDDPDKWRDQLKQAIYLYKAKGTRQALANAVNMVIPSGIYNPNSPTSGIQELWESYVPNILYYTLKTETDLGKDNAVYKKFLESWKQALTASGIKMNLTNYDPHNKDNNVRYAVDYILELLNIKEEYLDIGGIPYKETSFYEGQLARGLQNPGYFYRERLLSIPPWEESRFYQNCGITDNFVINLSSILASKIEDAGLGLDTSTANVVAEYISSSVSIKDANGFLEPGWGDNNNFKFMSSSLNLPFNYHQVIRSGDMEGMSVFDYWNSKASTVHTKLNASAIDFSALDYLNVPKTKLGRKGIPTIVDVFRQFAPFHVLNKIYVGSGITDDYYGTRSGHDPKQSWSGTMDLEIINTIQSDSDQVNSTYALSAFPGTYGTGIFSGVGIHPSIYNPQNGRWMPSATLHNHKSYFWSGGGVKQTGNTYFDGYKQGGPMPRTAGRRRSLKYKFTGWAQNREGLNQPIATDWFGVSAPLRTLYKRQGLKIPGFVPKGFNFSSQSFVDTSGSLSGVYSFYAGSATQFYEFAGSSNFPARNSPPFQPNASSFNQLRDVFGSQILRALTTIFQSRGKEDTRWLDFTNTSFRNFKFGQGVIQLYQEYNEKYRRQLQNWVYEKTNIMEDQYGGGYNILSHAFGPTLFNHNFGIKGNIISNLNLKAFSNAFSQAVSSNNQDWSAIATTKGNLANTQLISAAGQRRELSEGILQNGAYNTYINPLDTFERPSELYYANDSLVSGVELVAPPVNSIAVWNHLNNPTFNVDKISPSGITIIQRHNTDLPRQGIRVRFPIDGNINYSYNGQLRYPPRDSAKTVMATSSIAGWALYDQYRTQNINTEGGYTAGARITFSGSQSSSLPFVRITGYGRGVLGGISDGIVSGVITRKRNPSLVTVVNHPDAKPLPICAL